ncbi:MAG TPA: hypothetical protein VFW33_03580, partial [Gemmataceae bacterium]|nr:hypothetical protein [Gemmataceae bacterium]
KRKVARASAITKLRAGLMAEADTKREGDPNHLIRTYGCLNLLSGGEAERWARAQCKKDCQPPAFVGSLGISKAQALTPLVTQPPGTDAFTWTTGDEAGTLAVFAWACGPEAPTTQDIELRVAYHRGQDHGRYLEFSRMRHRCRTAAEFDGLIAWAKSLGDEARLPDGRTVLRAAEAAKARVFPTSLTVHAEAGHPGAGEAHVAHLPGEAEVEELAPAITSVITGHPEPEVVFEGLLRQITKSADMSGAARRAAAAALVILDRADKRAAGAT